MTELVDSSLLYSDCLCVCALCEQFQVEFLLEAGTGFGGSTEAFARYFAATGPVRHIWSVDLSVNRRWERLRNALGLRIEGPYVWSHRRNAHAVARARLQPFDNVSLIIGDAHDELPRLLATLGSARVGVVIDGPKRDAQLQLAERLLRSSRNVAFAALDDIGPIYDDEQRHARFAAHPLSVFATSDRAFFDRFGWINAGRLPARMIGRPEHTGYGMGVMVQP